MDRKRVDHTGIVVSNLDDAVARFGAMFGGRPGDRVTVADQRVDVVFVQMGDSRLELIQPLDDDSAVARFLRRRGEGLHHLAIAVDDIRAELATLAANGVQLIDREPRPGAHGLIAFIHPRSCGGVLFELVQHTS